MHIVPQTPQFEVSVFTLAQELAQFCVPVGQLVVHLLAAQTWFAPQAMPHAPQLLGSVSVRTHAPPHLA